jgi:hypothetical protein
VIYDRLDAIARPVVRWTAVQDHPVLAGRFFAL